MVQAPRMGGRAMDTSEAVDDYLKIIFALTHEGGDATTGRIAERLSIAPASVTGMIKKLAATDPPLVLYTKSRGVRLADAGRRRALEIVRHHRLLETFLLDILKIPRDRVHEEAERLEHYISEEVEDAIARHLGDPLMDPHGSPIPRKDGHIPDLDRVGLLEMTPGEEGTVVFVPQHNRELVAYLDGLGVQVGALVRVDRREPFGGPVFLVIDAAERILGPEALRGVLVVRGSRD